MRFSAGWTLRCGWWRRCARTPSGTDGTASRTRSPPSTPKRGAPLMPPSEPTARERLLAVLSHPSYEMKGRLEIALLALEAAAEAVKQAQTVGACPIAEVRALAEEVKS